VPIVKPADAYRTILGLVEVNDWQIFEDAARKLPFEFPPQHRSTYLNIGNILSELVRDYDYTNSAAFVRDTSSSSSAVLAAKRRRENEPVRRAERRKSFFSALAALPETRMAYDLVASSDHARLDRLREFIQKLES
jgi:hypothetical protein